VGEANRPIRSLRRTRPRPPARAFRLAGPATRRTEVRGLDAWIFHPIQVALDYPVAWGLLGLAGALARPGDPAWRMIAGIAVGGLLRDVAHTISGVVWFSQFCPEGMNLWAYSTVYNASYMIPETAIAAALVPTVLRRVLRSRVAPEG